MRFPTLSIIAFFLLVLPATPSAWGEDSGDFTRGFDRIVEPSVGSFCIRGILNTVRAAKAEFVRDAAARTLSDDEIETFKVTPIEELSLESFRRAGESPESAERAFTASLIRALDVTHAVVALPFAIPAVGVFALMIRMDSKGPVFYVATRVGQDGKPIKILKLRTMRPDSDKLATSTAEDDPRIAGKWAMKARKFKVDELPQLLSVLRGDLSIVGSRPLDVPEVDLAEAQIPGFTKLRHEHKPGLANIPQAVMPHSGDIKTAEGRALREEKFYAEVKANVELEKNIISEYYKTIALVIHAVISGTGAR